MNTKANSTISEITVYTDRILVTRKLETQLTNDMKSVEFDFLPFNIVPGSLRITGAGTAGVKILGIDTKSEYYDVIPKDENKALEDKVLELTDEYNKIESNIKSLEQNGKNINELIKAYSLRFKEEFYFNKTDTEELARLIDSYKTIYDDINKNILELNRNKRKTSLVLNKVKNELNQKKSGNKKESLSSIITIEVTKAGDFSFYLSYITFGASWKPVYDVRYLKDSVEIELSYYGMVEQNTGENWEKIKLYLSTAKPAISASLPELNTRFIDFDDNSPGENYYAKSEGTIDYTPGQSEAKINKGLSVVFSIVDTVDLNSGESFKKVPIAKKRFPVEILYRTYPKYCEAVYLTGLFENNVEFPFLEGDVKIYHNNDYIGDSFLNTVLAGEKATLSMGVDDSIKVKRELIKNFTQYKGVTSGNVRRSFQYKITVQNFSKDKQSIKIEENIPVSKNKLIKVETVKISPKSEPDYKGILKWDLIINPGEKSIIDIEYFAEYPKNILITGLDI